MKVPDTTIKKEIAQKKRDLGITRLKIQKHSAFEVEQERIHAGFQWTSGISSSGVRFDTA